MHKQWILRAALPLSTLLATACGDPDPGANGDTSYSAAVQNGSADSAGDSAAKQAGVGSAHGATSATDNASDLALHSGKAFQNYLVDQQGRALYVFANDAAGTSASTCTGACLQKWQVFDAKNPSLGEGITATDVSRFMRPDGAWQTTFKGRPLYYFAADTATSGVGGDGVGGRWFVARDYTVFLAAKSDLTPDAASAAVPFMTNRAGRTVYVFKNDTAGSASAQPTSACNDACLDAWPVWKTPGALTDLVLPSNMKAADFGQLMRTVAGSPVEQLSYRGWPLYFHTPDDLPGETSGHMSGAWRAIDPVSFAASDVVSDTSSNAYPTGGSSTTY